MLQVRVDDREHFAAGGLPAADDGGRESLLAAPPHHAHHRQPLRDAHGDFPGAVGAVVVHDDDLVFARQRRLEHGCQLPQELLEVA